MNDHMRGVWRTTRLNRRQTRDSLPLLESDMNPYSSSFTTRSSIIDSSSSGIEAKPFPSLKAHRFSSMSSIVPGPCRESKRSSNAFPTSTSSHKADVGDLNQLSRSLRLISGFEEDKRNYIRSYEPINARIFLDLVIAEAASRRFAPQLFQPLV